MDERFCVDVGDWDPDDDDDRLIELRERRAAERAEALYEPPPSWMTKRKEGRP